jgi:hypothetical protein
VTNAIKDVAVSVGGLATELFELRDIAQRAETDLVVDELDDLIERPAAEPVRQQDPGSPEPGSDQADS